MKVFLAAVAAFATFGGFSVAEAAKAKKPPAAPPPAEAPAPTLMEPLAASLQAYAAFQADIDLVNGGSIQNPKDIERALDKAAALNREQLTRGFIAYGALTAARNEQFVTEVRKVAAAYGKPRVVKALLNNSNYAGTIAGGDKATEFVIRAAAADSDRVIQAGERVKARAREAQKLKWGKALSGAAAPRMARLKTLAEAAKAPPLAPEQSERLKIVAGSGDPTLDPVSFGGESFWRVFSAKPPETATLTSLPVSARTFNWTLTSGGAGIRAAMLTLAALYALDATADQPEATDAVLNNKITNGCLQGAQLQFYQCVASAHFNYENMACIGDAGISTVGMCIGDAAK
jgi:uncharacterized protein (DUF1778 family)